MPLETEGQREFVGRTHTGPAANPGSSPLLYLKTEELQGINPYGTEIWTDATHACSLKSVSSHDKGHTSFLLLQGLYISNTSMHPPCMPTRGILGTVPAGTEWQADTPGEQNTKAFQDLALPWL